MAVPAVRLDDLQLTVVPGQGLVGRFGEVALLALTGGSGAAIDQLLATCRALGALASTSRVRSSSTSSSALARRAHAREPVLLRPRDVG